MLDALDSRVLPSALSGLDDGLVVVTGTSGKSTTTKMLVAVLRAHGRRVFTNDSTANLRQGLASALIDTVGLDGQLSADIAVVELDEGAVSTLADMLDPRLVLLTNLSPDQLDRFESPNRVARLVSTMTARAPVVVGNADDPLVDEVLTSALGQICWFGVSAQEDGVQLELGEHSLVGGATYDPLKARLAVDGRPLLVDLPAAGHHYALDAAAAIAAARNLLATDFDPVITARAFAELAPVFGRGELVELFGETIEFVLVQNPASLRANLDVLTPPPPQLMFAVGSDVRDDSWLWTVDTADIGRVDMVSGSKAYELAVRLCYDGVQMDVIQPDLRTALSSFLALPPPLTGRKVIVFSADVMRRTRHILGLDRAPVIS